jgi:predicted DNA-binding protein (UPF0251 family)
VRGVVASCEWNERGVLPGMLGEAVSLSGSGGASRRRPETADGAWAAVFGECRGCAMSAALAFLYAQELQPDWEYVEYPEEEVDDAEMEDIAVGLAFYRFHTEGMLRRYGCLSMEAGRTPSLLGRELFRGKVTNYRVHGFDDVVIFLHDVGHCLETLSTRHQTVLRLVALQEFVQEEAARRMGVPHRTVRREYLRALDCLTEVFLEAGLLEPLLSCQEVKTSCFGASN